MLVHAFHGALIAVERGAKSEWLIAPKPTNNKGWKFSDVPVGIRTPAFVLIKGTTLCSVGSIVWLLDST